MKKIILSIVLLSGTIMQSQTFEWVNTPTLPETVNAHSTAYTAAADPFGNVYLTGFKNSPTLLNEVMGNVYYNKYDNNGGLIFSKEISGKCVSYTMVSDSQGNIALALAFTESMTIGTTTLTVMGDEIKHVLVKLDTQGNLLWYKQLSIDLFELGIVEDFRAIAIDAEDNIYVGYDNYFYSYVTKYSPAGDELINIEQQHVNRITSVGVDTEGNIYAAGSCAGQQSKYAGVDAPTDFSYSLYVVKYSPQGVFKWIKYVEDITCPTPKVVAKSPDEVYLSSWLFTENNFDDIETEGPGENFNDIFIAKLNAQGNFQWVREAFGTGEVQPGQRNYLSLDNEGNIYFAGSTRGTLNWGNTITTTVQGFPSEGLLLKYNPEGEILFAKTAGGSSEDRFDSVCVNAFGEIFITGVSSTDALFDGIEIPDSGADQYPILAKLSTEILGSNIPETGQLSVYPNPSSGIITIKGIDKAVPAVLLNMLGQKIKVINDVSSGTLDLSNFASGTYLLKIEGFKTIKIIKT